ncbi:hypothetical protein OCH239_22190 [Roseivivax halodurans JCM 10272]|uniref:Uncharacterized protein n=1 Tax=Roseivivax halodurans JCM 10272 TaxID=1449350 RepID=X7EFK0_9RHOB|nr:hypothetical protein [Roseivivax halodurans]ETX14722.1 hypothetical protein OCH239_22190 [Roseivivax halodurans JCM 10272]
MTMSPLTRPARRHVDAGAALAVISALFLLVGVLALAIGAPPAPQGTLDWHGNSAVEIR